MVQKCKKRKLESNGVASPFTNKRFLSKDEVEKQLQKERQARLNAEKREKYWREKFEAECLEMDDEDHTDLSAMFDKAGSNVPEHMASLCGNNSNNSCDAKVKRHIAGIRSKQCKLFTYRL